MGKASRGRRERSRDQAGQWTSARGARAAQRARAESLRCLPSNPWVRAALASNINNVVGELQGVLMHSDLADMADDASVLERDAALSMVLGKQGFRERVKDSGGVAGRAGPPHPR
ncbi:hypothetical protein [Streptomyces sp. LARHCF252]